MFNVTKYLYAKTELWVKNDVIATFETSDLIGTNIHVYSSLGILIAHKLVTSRVLLTSCGNAISMGCTILIHCINIAVVYTGQCALTPFVSGNKKYRSQVVVEARAFPILSDGEVSFTPCKIAI